jgi:hypothetical protein
MAVLGRRLPLLAGILFADAPANEVWWTCIPNLWRFRDSNDDGYDNETSPAREMSTRMGVQLDDVGGDSADEGQCS